jgi:hypothetical protein
VKYHGGVAWEIFVPIDPSARAFVWSLKGSMSSLFFAALLCIRQKGRSRWSSSSCLASCAFTGSCSLTRRKKGKKRSYKELLLHQISPLARSRGVANKQALMTLLLSHHYRGETCQKLVYSPYAFSEKTPRLTTLFFPGIKSLGTNAISPFGCHEQVGDSGGWQPSNCLYQPQDQP